MQVTPVKKGYVCIVWLPEAKLYSGRETCFRIDRCSAAEGVFFACLSFRFTIITHRTERKWNILAFLPSWKVNRCSQTSIRIATGPSNWFFELVFSILCCRRMKAVDRSRKCLSIIYNPVFNRTKPAVWAISFRLRRAKPLDFSQLPRNDQSSLWAACVTRKTAELPAAIGSRAPYRRH